MFWAEARTPASINNMKNIERMRPGLSPVQTGHLKPARRQDVVQAKLQFIEYL